MKKLKIVFLSLLGLVAVLLISVHLLLTYKAKELLQKVVHDVSKGKYELEAKKVTFYYNEAGISASLLKIKPTTAQEGQATIEMQKLEIRISSIMDLIYNRKLAVKKIEFIQPSIVAYGKKKTTSEKKDISAIIETAQQKLFDLIDVLNVQQLKITDAAIKIYTADSTHERYFSVNHFNVQLHEIDIEKGQAGIAPIFKMDGNIHFDHPEIHLPDTSLSASIGNLTADIANNSLQIDSLEMKISGGFIRQPQYVKLSLIRLAKMNWKRYLQEGLLEFDSLIAKSGHADITVLKHEKNTDPKDKAVKRYSGNSIMIHHAMVQDITYDLHAKKLKDHTQKQVVMKLQGDSLHLKELNIIHGKLPAISVKSMNLGIKDFIEKDENGSQSISLKGLSINDKTLVLKDYVFETDKNDKNRNYLKVSIPEFKLEEYRLEDVFLKRLVAAGITLHNPDIMIDIRKEKPKDGAPKKNINSVVKDMMQSVSQKMTLGQIVIKDGNFTLLPTLSPKDVVSLTGLSLVIDASKLPQIHSAMDLMHAVKELTSSEFMITGKNILLKVKGMRLYSNPRGFYVGSISGKFGEGKVIDLKGITILNKYAAFDPTKADGLHVSDLMVESGTVTIKKSSNVEKKQKNNGLLSLIKVDNLGLQNIVFKLDEGEKMGISSALNIDAKNIEFRDKQLYWSTLNVAATETGAALQKTTFDAGSLTVSQPGTINIKHAKGKTSSANAMLTFAAEEMDVVVGFQSTVVSSLKIEALKLIKPVIHLQLQKKENNLAVATSSKVNKKPRKDISLESLEMIQPSFDITIKDPKGMQTHSHKVFTGTLNMKNIHTADQFHNPVFSVEKFVYVSHEPKSNIGNRSLSPSFLSLSASNFVFHPESKHFSMLIDSAYLQDITQTIIGKKQDTMDIKVGELGITHLPYSKGDSLTASFILSNATWWSKKMNFSLSTPKQIIHAININVANKKSISLAIDSFSIMPRESKENMWAATPYEKAYNTLTGGPLKAEGVSITLQNNQPQIYIKKLLPSRVHFSTEKDKTKLEDTIAYRPLLARQLMNIPIPMIIDSILLNNARVDAHDISNKTGKKTHIFFTELNGWVKDVKTHDIKEKDTLEMRVRARFYGTDVVRVHYKQSYYDSLQGFWMRVRMSHFNMPEMNRLLTPLMGLKIESGIVDSLLLVAYGNNYFAYGTMDLRYHHLKAKLLKTEETKGKFKASIANFLTGFLLRKHDNGHTNLLYKERIQKRGLFNFWGKIALEGLLSNLGIKRDKAEHKKFENAVKKYNLPEKYWEDIDDDL